MHTHTLTLSPDHPDYDRCTQCGSLFRRDSVDADVLYGKGYWDREGHSTLEEQVYNCANFTNEHEETKWSVVSKHASIGESALEIACAPGIIAKNLRLYYHSVVGIEYDVAYKERMEEITHGKVHLLFGSFPNVTKDIEGISFDYIVALDILEHVEDGEAFMAEVVRLLKPGGKCLVMSPFLFDYCEPLPDRMYCDEHLAIYSQKYIREWFGTLFREVQFGRWVPGHEYVVAVK